MLHVIGSGFGRTGTLSMKHALESLGFGRCYHMQEVVLRPSHMAGWGRWRPGRPFEVELLDGFGATVDFPASLAFAELLGAFPDAKVVHTVRDPERWWASTEQTIYRARELMGSVPLRWVPPLRSLYDMLDEVLWDGLLGGRFEDRDHAVAAFEAWTEHVVATVPAERLLVFDVAQGWAPLCAFLDVPVPDRPFPRVNDAVTFRRRLAALRVATRAVPALAVGLPVAALARRRR